MVGLQSYIFGAKAQLRAFSTNDFTLGVRNTCKKLKFAEIVLDKIYKE